MESANLRVFEAVARLGGMNKAASELNTVQSNVTARIRMLEDELGVALFERHSRGVVLTPAGRRLLPYAVNVGRMLREARRAVRDDGAPNGSLAIGSLETTAAMRLPPVLALYASRFPAVDLTLTTGTTAELVAAVLDHRIEGAFVCGPVRHAELEEETVFREELVLVTARGLRSTADVLSRPELKIVVLRAGCSYRQRLESLLAARGIVGLRRLEFGTIEGILGCVAAGIGVTLLPRGIVAPAASDGRVALHDLARDEALVDTVFVRRRGAYASTALTAFLAAARPPARAEAAA
jgi:DNA-binding transcriptional LysR family regulator